MAGVAVGSIVMTRKLAKIKNDLSLLRILEVSIILFSFFTAVFITKFFNLLHQPLALFIFLLIIAGALIGLEFPLASKIYLRRKEEIGQTAGLLYFADLAGGWLAGILGGIIFLPILGLFNSCMVMVLFKLSSLFLLTSIKI
jgi:spermidine synthase